MHVNTPLDDNLQTNVLVSDGSPLVTDMCCSLTSPLPTENTAVWCAPRWTAPERFDNGGEATVEGDVWAFGMTILVRSTTIL